MPRSLTLYPHAVSTALELRVADPYDPTQELDLSWIMRGTETETGQITLDLSQPDVPWRELRMQLTATLAPSELERVLPPPSEPKDDAQLIISAQCPSTKMRQALELKWSAPGVWRGDLTFRRSETRGNLRLHPRVVRRTTKGNGDESGAAAYRAAIIAEGRDVVMIVDHHERPPEGTVQIKWGNFGES